jgi:hypothetical protein
MAAVVNFFKLARAHWNQAEENEVTTSIEGATQNTRVAVCCQMFEAQQIRLEGMSDGLNAMAFDCQ